VVAVAALLSLGLLPGVSARAADTKDLPTPVMDEVLIQNTRLYVLRHEVELAEERFYALYNELNSNHDFDVHCVDEARLGTLLRKKVCKPAYVEAADQEQGRSFVDGRPVIPTAALAEARRAAYHRNMREVVEQNPKLLRLLFERANLAQRAAKLAGAR
jgi:hypothetical protein